MTSPESHSCTNSDHSVRSHSTPLVDGVAGLRAIELADAILKSVSAHRWDGATSDRQGPNVLLNAVTGHRAAA